MALPDDIPRTGREGTNQDVAIPVTVDEMRYQLVHGRNGNLGKMLTPDGSRLYTWEETFEVEEIKGDFRYCPILYNGYIDKDADFYKSTNCINPPKILKKIHRMSDYDFMSVIIHEYGHSIGKSIIEVDGVSDSIDMHISRISFSGDSNDNVAWLRGNNYDEFITSYARTARASWDADAPQSFYEEISEDFKFYLLQGKVFRARAAENIYLQKKYDFLKTYVFMEREYDTGDMETYESILEEWGDFPSALLVTTDSLGSSGNRPTIWEGDYPLYT
jgi:hypothetical protein